MDTALVTSASSLVAVLLGFVTTYVLNRRLERQKNQLARVNSQLSQLYGPLFALTQSNGIVFREFSARNDPMGLFDHPESDFDSRITEMQRETYRKWMRAVLQPNNKRTLDILLSKADLLVGGSLPPSALTFFAHVAGYEVVMQGWDSGDFGSMFSIVDYPAEFSAYVAETYSALQVQQSRLLARNLRRWPFSRRVDPAQRG